MVAAARTLTTVPVSEAPSAPNPISDERLLRQLIAGSEAALETLYDRYAASVFATSLRASGDRTVAADVVQETFLTLWNRAGQFDPSRGSLIAWLSAIARNRTIDHARAAGRRLAAVPFSAFGRDDVDDGSIAEWLETSGDLIGAAVPEPGPDSTLASREARDAIAAALAVLPTPERLVIVLAYQEGLSQSEIAARLDWPLGTVKTRMRRAHRQLRDVVDRSASYA